MKVKITKDTLLFEALQSCPEIAEIFETLGMGCVGCMGSMVETMEIGAKMHNIALEKLLKEVNLKLEKYE